MNALTTQAIVTSGRQLHPNELLHETTIAYIQSLLQPYAEAIEQATTIDSIRDWIPQALPGELAKHANSELTKAARTGDLEAVKVAVIGYLLDEIIELSGNVARDNGDIIVIPWDVQKAIGFDEELSTLTGITNDPQTLQNREPRLLPVVINGYTHYLSQDFVAGLLLFSLRIGRKFNVTMFGTPFSPIYMASNRYTVGEPAGFKVSVLDADYNFNSPDFMQGFATGAEWASVDHHNYWSDLYQIDEDGNEIPITF